MMRLAFILMTLAAASSASAGDYQPVVCKAAAAYAGPAQRTYDLSPVFSPGQPASFASAFDPATATALVQAFDKARTASKAISLTVSVNAPGRGQWTANTSQPARLYFWASAGKTFTAVAILQLVDEGKIALSDPVSKWIDGVPNGDVITIRHLLTHTSGLFSANEDVQFRRTPRRLSLDEELKILRRHGAMACPGEQWRYSNSGYALLGAILERVEGKPYDQIITARVLSRLNRSDIRAVTPDDALSDVEPPVSQSPEPAIDVHQPGPAGGIVASAPAMIAAWSALLNGQLLKPETTKAMFAELYPMFGEPQSYGQGVMVYDLEAAGAKGEGQWAGHSGGAPGVRAIVAYSPVHRAFVAVALTGDGPAEAVAALMLRQVK